MPALELACFRLLVSDAFSIKSWPWYANSDPFIVPLYQSETAPKWIRGMIVGVYQLAITIGILFAAIVNNGTHKREDTGSYRIPIALQWLFSLTLIIGMHFLPETPRYCIKRGDMTRATRALARIRCLSPNDPAILAEMEEIRANYQYELSLGNSSYLDCFRTGMLKRMLTGMVLQILQQLTGSSFHLPCFPCCSTMTVF